MLLYFVRHGDRATKAYNSVESLDKGLTTRGRRQARLLAAHLAGAGIQALYSSPFPRTMQTAEAIGAETGLEPAVVNAFRELNVGKWNSFLPKQLDVAMPGERRKWHSHPESYRYPDGENLRELQARVMPALEKILQRGSKRSHERVCIVTHQAVIQIVLCSLLPKASLKDFHKYAVEKASLTVIEVGRGKTDLLLFNDSSHLKV